MTDLICNTDADTGLKLGVACPECGEEHAVALTRIGRFAFKCGHSTMNGKIPDFLTNAAYRNIREAATTEQERG